MKLKKRLWVLLLSAAMIVTFLPAAVFADDPAPGNGDVKVTETGEEGEEPTLADQAFPQPKWAVYKGAPLRGVLGTDTIVNLETPDLSSFDVTFTDGSVKTYTYRQAKYGEGDDTYDIGEFIDVDAAEQDPKEADICLYPEVMPNDEDPVSFEKGWNDNIELQLIVQYAVPGDNPDDVEIEQKALSSYVDVLCAADEYPLAVEFIPAEGFTLETVAGDNYVYEDIFYGEGNAFRVSYNGWTTGDSDKGIEEGFENFTRTYIYAKGVNSVDEEVEGFFASGNVNKPSFVLDSGAYCDIAFNNTADVEFEYTEYVEEYNEYVTVPFTVPLKATKHNVSVNYPTFKYTGNVVTPTFKVHDDNGKLIPAKAYDVTHENAKKMGWYEATITFNDNLEDKDNYVDSVTTSYGIGPQAPVIYNPIAGKKKLTVKWKKPISVKNLDGYLIELSTDRDFIGNYKSIWVKKATVKKGRVTISKNLKRNKRYYIRISAYKTITQDGEKFKMFSNYSKVKYKKTK